MAWTEKSGYNLGTFAERQVVSVPLPIDVAGATTYNIALIAGTLPQGLFISGTSIIGTPLEVSTTVSSTFVLRATIDGKISDRSFTMSVVGASSPVWSTNSGLLPIGPNNSTYILEDSFVNFKFNATDSDSPTLSFLITAGQLPTGLVLSPTGMLTGKLENIQHSTPVTYSFEITVSDGVLSASRTFSIIVIPKLFFSADNTNNLINEYPFSADVSPTAIVSWDQDSLPTGYFTKYYLKKITTLPSGVVSLSPINFDSTVAVPVVAPPSSNLYGLTEITVESSSTIVPGNVALIDGIAYTVESTSSVGNLYTLQVDKMLHKNLIPTETLYIGTKSLLPPGLKINSNTNEIYGTINYSSAMSKEFKFTLRVDCLSDGRASYSYKQFVIVVKNQTAPTVQWITDPVLGQLNPDESSPFKVEAVILNSSLSPIYKVTNGVLPPGLMLQTSGNIVGIFDRSNISPNVPGITVFENDFTLDSNSTSIDRRYGFDVSVCNQDGAIIGTRTFYIRITDTIIGTSTFIVKPMLSAQQMQYYDTFINDVNIFQPELIFKSTDPLYGVQKELRMPIISGLELLPKATIAIAIQATHEKKQFTFGNLKKVVVSYNNTLSYEVVYIEVCDPLEVGGNHLPQFQQIGTINKTTSSVYWWRNTLSQLGTVNSKAIPPWILPIQQATGTPVEKINAIPVCYCIPGAADHIIKNIQQSKFNFNNLNFIVDRYEINRVQDYNYPTTILFNQGELINE